MDERMNVEEQRCYDNFPERTEAHVGIFLSVLFYQLINFTWTEMGLKLGLAVGGRRMPSQKIDYLGPYFKIFNFTYGNRFSKITQI